MLSKKRGIHCARRHDRSALSIGPISHLQPLCNPALLPARLSWRFVEFGFANEPHPWLEKPDFPKPLPQSRGRFEQFLERQEDG